MSLEGDKKKLEKLVDKLKELKYSDIQYTNGEEIKSVKRQITIFWLMNKSTRIKDLKQIS